MDGSGFCEAPHLAAAQCAGGEGDGGQRDAAAGGDTAAGHLPWRTAARGARGEGDGSVGRRGWPLAGGCARPGCASRARVRHAYRAQRAAASHAVLRAVPDAPLYRCNRRHAAHERTPLAACRHGGAAYGARQSRARIRRRLRYLAHLAAISKLHAAAKLVQYVTRRRQALAGGDQAGRSGTGKRQAVRRMRLMRWMIRRIQARMRGRRTRSRVYKRMPRLAEIASHAEKARLRAN